MRRRKAESHLHAIYGDPASQASKIDGPWLPLKPEHVDVNKSHAEIESKMKQLFDYNPIVSTNRVGAQTLAQDQVCALRHGGLCIRSDATAIVDVLTRNIHRALKRLNISKLSLPIAVRYLSDDLSIETAVHLMIDMFGKGELQILALLRTVQSCWI